MAKYTFSGHESFTCKTLWLKKGYDFIDSQYDFNAPEAVIQLGVGKNMVSAIRYWLRAFGISENDKNTEIASYLFDNEKGKDPYVEDLGTLWLLHFLLVNSSEATLYNWIFVKLQREKKEFTKQSAIHFVQRTLIEEGKPTLFNENTVKKDLAVLLQNYLMPTKPKALDDYNALLIELELLRTADEKSYQFNYEGKRQIPWQIFLFAILRKKGDDNTISYDTLQEIGLMFCMNDMEVIQMCMDIEEKKPNSIRYSDTAGIKQIQFLNTINENDILNEYYD